MIRKTTTETGRLLKSDEALKQQYLVKKGLYISYN